MVQSGVKMMFPLLHLLAIVDEELTFNALQSNGKYLMMHYKVAKRLLFAITSAFLSNAMVNFLLPRRTRGETPRTFSRQRSSSASPRPLLEKGNYKVL